MPRRVLVGLDHSDEAVVGLRRGVAIACAERAELTLVHVAVPPPSWVGVGMLAMPLVEDVVASGCELMREALDDLPDDLAVRWFVISGAEASSGLSRPRCVRRALTCAFAKGDHDLLVLGTGVTPGRVVRAMQRQLGDRVVTAAHRPMPAGPGAASKRTPVLGEMATPTF
ncbi:MAG: Universal stress protein family [Solirubrobacterales bacterium]|nr:Universal stress protein family [Solirubrobacterales bacterium]